jgi:hypothetical protein
LAVENFSCNCPATPIGPFLIFFSIISHKGSFLVKNPITVKY